MTLIFHAFDGQKSALNTAFSVLTFLRFKTPEKVLIYTDQATFLSTFFNNHPQVEIMTLSEEEQLALGAPDSGRMKSQILLQVSQKRKGSLFWVDPGVFFLKNPAELFRQLNPGQQVMASHSCRLDQATDSVWKKAAQLCRKENFNMKRGIISIPLATEIWDSGVIGIHESRVNLLEKISELYDAVSKVDSSSFVEPLVFSYFLQSSGKLKAGEPWVSKNIYDDESWQNKIREFFERNQELESGLQALEKIDFSISQEEQKKNWWQKIFVSVFVFMLTIMAGQTGLAADRYVGLAPYEIYFSDGSLPVRTFELEPEQAQELALAGWILEKEIIYRPQWVAAAQRKILTGDEVAETWAARTLMTLRVHNLSKAFGDGIKICVVDTGIDDSHPSLRRKVIEQINVVDGGPVKDRVGHGTHVASLIAGYQQWGAAAPNAKLISVKAIDDQEKGSQDSISRGIDLCVAKGAKIINLSLGSRETSEILRITVNRAISKGVILVAAAGNDGGAIVYPAAYPGVHAIGAVAENLQVARFSCKGNELDYVAPGVDILGASPAGNKELRSGTSMATAIMSGIFASVLSAGKSQIQTTDLQVSRNEQGKGFVNYLKSVL